LLNVNASPIQGCGLLSVVGPARTVPVVPIVIHEVDGSPCIILVRVNLDVGGDVTHFYVSRFSPESRDATTDER
jgi:hypothetical protein